VRRLHPYAQVYTESQHKLQEKHFKMRSSMFFTMPYFRAQMNCVPGMVTEFAFEPIYTTAEYREPPYMVKKVANINAIRAKKSIGFVAQGKAALDPV
jgi:cytochrome c oxidase subunit 2